MSKAQLTLGPVLFNWPAHKKLDFYNMIADEADIKTVYLGEVVCQKRFACWGEVYDKIVDRLVKAGKQVIISSLALVNTDKELEIIKRYATESDLMIEANDISVLASVPPGKFCLGPYINVYNEDSLNFYANKGAAHITFAPELPRDSIEILSRGPMAKELTVFGRLPLAISARCAHARIYKQQKSNCKYVCDKDSDGLTVETLDQQPFLVINGLQTMSYAYCNMLGELADLVQLGITRFRISPHDTNMLKVIDCFNKVLQQEISANKGQQLLNALLPDVDFANGFFHGTAGYKMLNKMQGSLE